MTTIEVKTMERTLVSRGVARRRRGQPMLGSSLFPAAIRGWDRRVFSGWAGRRRRRRHRSPCRFRPRRFHPLPDSASSSVAPIRRLKWVTRRLDAAEIHEETLFPVHNSTAALTNKLHRSFAAASIISVRGIPGNAPGTFQFIVSLITALLRITSLCCYLFSGEPFQQRCTLKCTKCIIDITVDTALNAARAKRARPALSRRRTVINCSSCSRAIARFSRPWKIIDESLELARGSRFSRPFVIHGYIQKNNLFDSRPQINVYLV